MVERWRDPPADHSVLPPILVIASLRHGQVLCAAPGFSGLLEAFRVEQGSDLKEKLLKAPSGLSPLITLAEGSLLPVMTSNPHPPC